MLRLSVAWFVLFVRCFWMLMCVCLLMWLCVVRCSLCVVGYISLLGVCGCCALIGARCVFWGDSRCGGWVAS